METIVADAVAEELRKAGIDRAFGLPGGEVLYLIEALRQKGIEYTLFRHEADAGIAAAVYGKLKGRPGVVMTTLGPGAANLMLPLTNSVLDREPLLAISAQIPEGWPQTHTHQLVPLLECYRPITKFADKINGYTARRTIRRALERALEAPAGPSYVTISAEMAVAPSYEAAEGAVTFPDQDRLLHSDNVAAAADALRQRMAAAERPLVLLGAGIDQCHAHAVREWLEAWNLPVGVTPKVKGMVDETGANFVGVFGGMSIDNLMVEALNHADLIVSLGFDPVEVDKTWHAQLPILWVLDAPLALDVVPQENLIAAPYRGLLEQLAEASPPRSLDKPFASFQKRRRDIYARGNPEDANLSENPVSIVTALAQVLPPETIVTTDVGSHKYLFGQFWPSRRPQTFFMSNGLSGMGYGLAAAIGAKLARPDAPVLAVLGDGGFSMNSQELETALRVGADLIVLVIADRSYSLIHHSQQNKQLPNYGVDFNPIDTVLTAKACGVDGVRVSTGPELASAVKAAVEQNQSLVVEVPVDVPAYKGLV